MNKQHKLFSARLILYPYHKMWYTIYNAKKEIYMSSLRGRVLRLQESARSAWSQALLLQERMQIRVEQDLKGLLGWKEDTVLSETKQEYRQRKEPKLEGRKTLGQGRLRLDTKERTPALLKTPRLCKGTPFGYGETFRTLFIKTGGSTS